MDNIESDLEYDFQPFNGMAMLNLEIWRACLKRGMQEPHSVWMVPEGSKPDHKKTILCLFIDPSLNVDYNKSHDRLLRVRYFSISGDSFDCQCR